MLLLGEGDELAVAIEDDGRGFDPSTVIRVVPGEGEWGLLGMRERVASLSGTFDIESAPGEGTTVFVRLPILADPGARESGRPS